MRILPVELCRLLCAERAQVSAEGGMITKTMKDEVANLANLKAQLES